MFVSISLSPTLARSAQGVKYFAAALQLDPDTSEAASKYKALRRTITETTRIRGEIDKALTGNLSATWCSVLVLIFLLLLLLLNYCEMSYPPF